MGALGDIDSTSKPGGRPRTTNIRVAINAILYLLCTGCL